MTLSSHFSRPHENWRRWRCLLLEGFGLTYPLPSWASTTFYNGLVAYFLFISLREKLLWGLLPPKGNKTTYWAYWQPSLRFLTRCHPFSSQESILIHFSAKALRSSRCISKPFLFSAEGPCKGALPLHFLWRKYSYHQVSSPTFNRGLNRSGILSPISRLELKQYWSGHWR